MIRKCILVAAFLSQGVLANCAEIVEALGFEVYVGMVLAVRTPGMELGAQYVVVDKFEREVILQPVTEDLIRHCKKDPGYAVRPQDLVRRSVEELKEMEWSASLSVYTSLPNQPTYTTFTEGELVIERGALWAVRISSASEWSLFPLTILNGKIHEDFSREIKPGRFAWVQRGLGHVVGFGRGPHGQTLLHFAESLPVDQIRAQLQDVQERLVRYIAVPIVTH